MFENIRNVRGKDDGMSVPAVVAGARMGRKDMGQEGVGG